MTEHLPFSNSWLPVRLGIEDYLLLDGSGTFENYAKTELIEGEIFAMNAQHRPHAWIKTMIYDGVRDALHAGGSALTALVEAAISIPPDTVPEPDIVVTSEPRGQGLVPLASVALVIEVADTTINFDLGRKMSLYAKAAIPEYWVADVAAGVVHQFWSPDDDRYVERRTVPFGETIRSLTIAGLMVETSGL